MTIQFCKVHDMATANNADGGGFDLDGATTNSVLQYNVSWNNHGYGYQLYDFFWGPHQNNTVRYNVTIGDGKVTSSRRPTPGQGVLVGFGNLINESFHHNVAYVENEGDSDVKLVQIDTWTGDSLAFHDNVYIAGESIRPFDVIEPRPVRTCRCSTTPTSSPTSRATSSGTTRSIPASTSGRRTRASI